MYIVMYIYTFKLSKVVIIKGRVHFNVFSPKLAADSRK